MGEFENVILTAAELQKLQARYGGAMANQYIEKLSCWRKDQPRKAKGSSDYSRLLNWLRKDVTIEKATPKPAPIIEEAEYRHRAQCMQNYQRREGWPIVDLDEIVRRLKDGDRERAIQ